MLRVCKTAFLVLLLIAAVWTLTHHDRETADTTQIRSIYQSAIVQLDAMGRLPMKGAVAGEINNAYQLVRHPGRPEVLGCGDQAAFVYARLNNVPGWSFEMRYEYGVSSPILLPHQWITGHGPNGRTVQIDPWSDTFIAE
jgi:hypothetical protein